MLGLLVDLRSQGDGELARRIMDARGRPDRAAEAELWRRFAPRVRLYGLRHLRREDEAEDLAQRVLLMTIEKLRAADVREPDRIGSFILGCARLTSRRARRKERDFASTSDIELPAAIESLALDTLVLRERLKGCFEALAERERTILVSTYYAEQPAAEVARTLGLSTVNVRVVRHRSLAKLRNCIEERVVEPMREEIS